MKEQSANKIILAFLHCCQTRVCIAFEVLQQTEWEADKQDVKQNKNGGMVSKKGLTEEKID